MPELSKEELKIKNTIRFIEAAQELIDETGVENVSIRKIAERAGENRAHSEHERPAEAFLYEKVEVIKYGAASQYAERSKEDFASELQSERHALILNKVNLEPAAHVHTRAEGEGKLHPELQRLVYKHNGNDRSRKPDRCLLFVVCFLNL